MPLASPILTPAVISKLPLGLLGFFGIKNGGQYPQSLAPFIQPTMRMEGILQANYHDNVGSTTGAGGITATGFKQLLDTLPGSGLPLIVPAGELWFVKDVTAVAFTGAGDSFTGSLVVRNTQTGVGSNFHRAVSAEIVQAASQFRQLPGVLTDFWLQPGDQIGAWITAFVNASTTASLGWNFQRTVFPF